jgi:nitroreductase
MLLDSIEKRRSYRSFDERYVEPEKINEIFEAGRWAASSMNEQPWRFVVRVKKDSPDSYDELFNTLSEGNKKWAGKAPILAAVLAKKNFEYKNLPNRHYMYDTGQAVANMMIQLTHLGLIGHQMGGFNMEMAKEVLNVNGIFEIVCIVAIGYKADPNKLPEDIREKEQAPRSRKNLDEIVFKDRMR